MNILVYVMDALRVDHVSSYGYERTTTPRIDKLAQNGIRYTRCFSPSTWTKPVGASLLTGAYPPTHGVRSREDLFNTDITRLPELLSQEGYSTVGVSTMGNVSASLGYDRGFDEYFDLYKDPDIIERRATSSAANEELDREGVNRVALPRAEDINPPLLKWIDENSSDDFFAFCWSIEPHIPYDPPRSHREFVNPDYDGEVDGSRESLPDVSNDEDMRQLIGLYDSEIKYNDEQLGLLLDGLRDRDVLDDTLVVVLGDHGDAFNEHGRLTHGHLAYDELAHVPLVIRPPNGNENSNSDVEEMTSLVDLCPTILEATDVENVPKSSQGRPLPPFGPTGSSSPVFSETRSRDIYPSFYAIRTDEWKYMEVDAPERSIDTLLETARQVYQRGLIPEIIRNPLYYLNRYRHSESRFLYNVRTDPEESNNLVQTRSEKVAELRESLYEWLNQSEQLYESLGNSGRTDIDAETAEQLRQLGYVD
ncbi:sulfatase [Halomarina rubra]|uniref:Sulfatase n=1 Tax=Halomarina rubra TaxID=2071873 RepID=A0ABD6AWF4_9EURY|nr:sulfatase [Halomarina rubra]